MVGLCSTLADVVRLFVEYRIQKHPIFRIGCLARGEARRLGGQKEFTKLCGFLFKFTIFPNCDQSPDKKTIYYKQDVIKAAAN